MLITLNVIEELVLTLSNVNCIQRLKDRSFRNNSLDIRLNILNATYLLLYVYATSVFSKLYIKNFLVWFW